VTVVLREEVDADYEFVHHLGHDRVDLELISCDVKGDLGFTSPQQEGGSVGSRERVLRRFDAGIRQQQSCTDDQRISAGVQQNDRLAIEQLDHVASP